MKSIPAPISLLALSFMLAGCAATQPAPAPLAKAGVPSEVTLKRVTTQLASDAFEGRSPGSAGEEKTVQYLSEQFRAAGLKPGNKGSWVQNVPLVEMEPQNITPLRFDTPAGVLALRPNDDFVAFSYRVQPRISVDASDVVFVGYGINAPEKGWNDYAGVDVRGKTVVILVNDPDWSTPTLDGPFGGRAMTYYGRWTYKFEEAARQGAAAALVVHDTEPAAYGWNVVRSSWTGPQYVAATANDGADQTAVNGWMQLEATRKLFRAAGQDFDALRARAAQPGFRAVALTGARASLQFDAKVRRFESRNVVGILPGRTRPDEVVLYTAHWDHLGRCTPNAAGDDICNGAVDNATGTAALVAIAEAQANTGAADRSMVFLAVTAEESGLLGADYYAANPIYPLAKTVGGVNMDALSPAGPARDLTLIGGGKSELDTYLAEAATAVGRVITAEPTPEKGFYYRSDHFPFAKRGVPMIYFDGGEDLIDGGKAAGAAVSADYTANRYHGPDDEVEAIARWDGMAADMALYYAIGRRLATGTAWPNWNPGDEFRAARDKSRAGQ